MSGVSASASASSPSHCFYNLQSKIQIKQEIYFVNPPLISCSSSSSSSHIKLKTHLGLRFETALRGYRKINVRCSSSSGPGGPGSASGDSDSRSVLDAFFLGKAVAEALNERVESAVGEFLSTIGRLQAEQQKQIQDFQEDVLGRAKKAKEQAAREAMEGQGIIPKPTTVETTSVNQGVSQTPSPSTANAVKTDSNPATEGPVLGVSSDD
ncbi:hypothetical protein D5086_005601 [Populus alba]|uniref:Uncharacterized protein n=2 Tax=Populus alba TaxID=43335 RepID=A0A4U5QMK7_POPAL|nr:uncharacterized protein At4g13200, chloroplastic [Populus alba]TKS12034.1 hypothetical protein D5086_0000066200 [Populus alba]